MGKRTRKDSPIPPAAKAESAALFRIARRILAEDSGIEESDVRDQHVCGLIYEQYPYGSLWKNGEKHVGTAVEMDLLARNLGVPLAWVIDLFEGRLDEDGFLRRYRQLRGDGAHGIFVEYGGPAGIGSCRLRLRDSGPQRAAVFSQLVSEWLKSLTAE